MLTSFELTQLDELVDEYRSERFFGFAKGCRSGRNHLAIDRFEYGLRKLLGGRSAHDNPRSNGEGSNSTSTSSTAAAK